MPYYCIDVDPGDYSDRKVHDLTQGQCDHLPPSPHHEYLGWHNNLYAAVAKAKLWYKTATVCPYCDQLLHDVKH